MYSAYKLNKQVTVYKLPCLLLRLPWVRGRQYNIFPRAQTWTPNWGSLGGFPCSSGGKESACNAGDLGSIPGSGRSPGGGNGNPLQYSCLENPMDRGTWQTVIHGVTKSWTRLSDYTTTAAAFLLRDARLTPGTKWFRGANRCSVLFVLFCVIIFQMPPCLQHTKTQRWVILLCFVLPSEPL